MKPTDADRLDKLAKAYSTKILGRQIDDAGRRFLSIKPRVSGESERVTAR